MLDDANAFEDRQVYQDLRREAVAPAGLSWSVLWINEDITLVLDHVVADDPFQALEAAAEEHCGEAIDPEAAVVFSGHHDDALDGPDPGPSGMRNWTVLWIDDSLCVAFDLVQAFDPRSAIEAAKADHQDDADAVTGDIVVLHGHFDDELYSEAQRRADC